MDNGLFITSLKLAPKNQIIKWLGCDGYEVTKAWNLSESLAKMKNFPNELLLGQLQKWLWEKLFSFS